MGARCTEVFIVDDVPSMRERLRELVREVPDVAVVGDAGTPAEAIAGILATRPACVLLDYQLVGGTGVDVLRGVHACSPGTVFVVLTNQPDPQYRRVCMDAGADHFFDKSAEFDRIGEVLRRLQTQ
ncbi:MAG: response regulator transcription factor [Burkholderiales bacterium]|nr:response regulator transcription factor [Burkholderiales bacterium]